MDAEKPDGLGADAGGGVPPPNIPVLPPPSEDDDSPLLKSWYAPAPGWNASRNPFVRWLFALQQDEEDHSSGDHTRPWYQVMCLTGVDYFSTLGYQPGIAFLAAQHLAPVATLFLVAMTLFAAYPIYKCVASRSPHGAGSIAMLENLLPQWWGKIFILVLLGFAATDFIITITLSAADATAHIRENPLFVRLLGEERKPGGEAKPHPAAATSAVAAVSKSPAAASAGAGSPATTGELNPVDAADAAAKAAAAAVAQNLDAAGKTLAAEVHTIWSPQVLVTLCLLALLSVVFLKGFKEAIGLAVVLTVVYLTLNFIVIVVCLHEVWHHPTLLLDWRRLLWAENRGSWWFMIAAALLVFPKLALGLSGFETGVAVMPLVRGKPDDPPEYPVGRIEATRKLLLVAALIMSFFLITSSLVTVVLIPPHEFLGPEGGQAAGKAYGRALAYLAHLKLGETFGTLYDFSTISVLWFAGASAMAGLLNIVPRYLPRYGMAPNWARYTRPLVIVFALIAVGITIVFEADVEKQGAAYATGVLVLMTSGAFAVLLAKWRKIWPRIFYSFVLFAFLFTLGANVVERPEGIHIASFFILATVTVSIVSRVWRSTELRIDHIRLDPEAQKIMAEMVSSGEIRLIACAYESQDPAEYDRRLQNHHRRHHVPAHLAVSFLEIDVPNASDFTGALMLRGHRIGGHRVLRGNSVAVANAIAALLIYLRDTTAKRPHIYFGWSEKHPMWLMLMFLLFGEGDIANMTREVIRQHEPEIDRRPMVHVG